MEKKVMNLLLEAAINDEEENTVLVGHLIHAYESIVEDLKWLAEDEIIPVYEASYYSVFPEGSAWLPDNLDIAYLPEIVVQMAAVAAAKRDMQSFNEDF